MKSVHRCRAFSGGHRFRRYLGQADSSLVELPVPARVTVPLLQGFGVPLRSLVRPGEKVAAGQVIARDDNTVCSPIHATIGGTVTGVDDIPHRGRRVAAVTIQGDGATVFARVDGHTAGWRELPRERIEEILYLSGVTGLGREGIPTRFRSAVVGTDDVRHLIVLCAGADAFSPNPAVFLANGGAEKLLEGAAILGYVLPKAEVHFAASGEHCDAAGELAGLAGADSKIHFHTMCGRYPQDSTEMLVRTVLGQDFPFGYSGANIGVVVVEAQAALAARDAVVEGRPVLDRIVALAGPGFEQPTHVRVRVGTPVERVVQGRLGKHPVRIVRDSLLSGTEVADLAQPVLRTDNLLIAAFAGTEREPFAFARPGLHDDSFSRSFFPVWLPTGIVATTNRRGEERPCIQCGWCARVCPVRIIPHLIYRQGRLGVNELLVNLGVFNCIDCNLCTFTCPSKIDLAAGMRRYKEELLAVGCDNSSCVLPKFDLRGIEDYKGVKSVR